jgi:hypothetical protein
MTEIDIDALTGPAAGVEHCGKPMRWQHSTSTWEGEPGQGCEQTASAWVCECGATLHVVVRVPS